MRKAPVIKRGKSRVAEKSGVMHESQHPAAGAALRDRVVSIMMPTMRRNEASLLASRGESVDKLPFLSDRVRCVAVRLKAARIDARCPPAGKNSSLRNTESSLGRDSTFQTRERRSATAWIPR